MRGNAARVAVPAIALLALAIVVVIAAGGSTPSGTGASRQAPDILLDSIISIGLVLLIPAAVIFLYALTQRKQIAQEIQKGRIRRVGLLGWIAFALIFALFAWYRGRNWEPATIDDELGDQIFPGGERTTTLPRDGAEIYEPEFAWIPVLVVVALTAVAAVAIFLSVRRRDSGALEERTAEEVAEILGETLDDLRAEADPRRAVIAAFARLEQTFSAAGHPRAPAATAQEFVSSALLELRVAEEPVARLAELYAVAKFSDHDVDAGMKDEAIAALEDVRDDLRSPPHDEEAAVALRPEEGHA